jgi:Ca2+:H+ antiporter
MLNTLLMGLLIFVPLTITAEYLHASPITVFFLATLAVIPLSKLIGEATGDLATFTGPALGGLLNTTFGNAIELIIGYFAIKAGLLDLVKASITGAIIGDLLSVLGLAMLFGGCRFKKQVFNRTAVLSASSSLLLAVVALVIPAIFLQTAPTLAGHTIENISILVALMMLTGYAFSLIFSLFTHQHLYMQEIGKYEPKWSKRKSLLILVVATASVAWISEILVGTIEPVISRLRWTQLFIGVIIVAVIGYSAEYFSAIMMARKNRMDLALQVSIGAATQSIMFVAPLLILLSLAFTPMNLIFNPFELAAIVLSVFIANFVVQDGESNWLEGMQLLIAYGIMAVAFYFHP